MSHQIRQTVNFARAAPVPAWLLSAVLHAAAIILLAFVVQPAPSGTLQPDDRPASVALVQSTSNQTEYFTEDSVANSAASNQQSTSTAAVEASALPQEIDFTNEIAGFLPASLETGSIGAEGEGLPAASDLLSNGVGQKPGGGHQTKTQVFGLPGAGSKFVYVFDRSASMSGFGGRPLKAAKRELIGSLAPMSPVNQFQVIFYNDKPLAISEGGKKPVMMWGGDRQKQVAREFVSGIVADGNTNHMPALQLALSLGPDVIFFLTDAEEPRLTPNDLRKIKEWNGAESVINTIEFGAGPAAARHNSLKEVARQNRGQHTYIDVTTLDD